MKTISGQQITAAAARLWAEANFELGSDVLKALSYAWRRERTPRARQVLDQILQNAVIARAERIPLCQDTGRAFVFIEKGEEVRLTSAGRPVRDQAALLRKAVNDGIALATKKYCLRASTVGHPLERKNTGANTPAVVHQETVPGSRLKLTVLAKGGGAENASQLISLPPTAEKKEIIGAVLKVVREKGPNACPPLVIGIGLGGSFDQAPLLAKKALLRPLGRPARDRAAAKLEKEILRKINKLGIGPAAFGGLTTALAVHLETAPCHIASLPLAINLDCHVHRLKTAVL